MIDIEKLRSAVKAAFPLVFGEKTIVSIYECFPEPAFETDDWECSEQTVAIPSYPFLLRPVMRPEIRIAKSKILLPGVTIEQVIMEESGCEEFGPEPVNHHVADILPGAPARPDLVIQCGIAKFFASIAEMKTHRVLVPDPIIGPLPF